MKYTTDTQGISAKRIWQKAGSEGFLPYPALGNLKKECLIVPWNSLTSLVPLQGRASVTISNRHEVANSISAVSTIRANCSSIAEPFFDSSSLVTYHKVDKARHFIDCFSAHSRKSPRISSEGPAYVPSNSKLKKVSLSSLPPGYSLSRLLLGILRPRPQPMSMNIWAFWFSPIGVKSTH